MKPNETNPKSVKSKKCLIFCKESLVFFEKGDFSQSLYIFFDILLDTYRSWLSPHGLIQFLKLPGFSSRSKTRKQKHFPDLTPLAELKNFKCVGKLSEKRMLKKGILIRERDGSLRKEFTNPLFFLDFKTFVVYIS